ncbi:MAG TPA: PDZ domain-containing protein [Gemmatimonadales bacterium]
MRSFMTLGLVIAVAGPAAGQGDTTVQMLPRSADAARINEMVRSQLDRVVAIQREQQALAEVSTARMHQLAAANVAPMMATVARASERARLEVGQLMAEARRTPRFGITLEYAARESDRYGAYVSAVTPGSPADRAGIIAGDVLTRIGAKSLARDPKADDDQSPAVRATEAIATLTPGKPVAVELRRGTQTRTVRVTPTDDETVAINRVTVPGNRLTLSAREMPTVTLRGMAAAPEMPSISNFSVFDDSGMRLGFGYSSLFANFELAPMNEKLGAYFGTTDGVLVVNDAPARQAFMVESFAITTDRATPTSPRMTGRIAPADSGVKIVRRDSSANAIPLQPGDVIVSVDGRKVTSPSQLMRIVASYDRGDEFKLQIMRQKHAETIPVKMP